MTDQERIKVLEEALIQQRIQRKRLETQFKDRVMHLIRLKNEALRSDAFHRQRLALLSDKVRDAAVVVCNPQRTS